MDVSFLPLQSRLEFLSPLQLFVEMSGQYPSPTVFLSRVRLCPNEQHSSIHSDPRWSLGILWVLGSLILTCFCWDLLLWLLCLFLFLRTP